jgi:hypothetical protein
MRHFMTFKSIKFALFDQKGLHQMEVTLTEAPQNVILKTF